jgi:hypothetical protein
MLTQNLILLNINFFGPFLVFMLVIQNTHKPNKSYYFVFLTFSSLVLFGWLGLVSIVFSFKLLLLSQLEINDHLHILLLKVIHKSK